MYRWKMCWAVIAIAASLGVVLAAPIVAKAEQGQMISKYSVPKEVQETADRATTNINWIIAFHFKEGKPSYRLLGKDARSHNICANVFEGGELINVYTCISLQEMPEAARNALKTRHPDFKPSEDFMSTKAVGLNDREVKYYSVEGTGPDKKKIYLLVRPDGREVSDASGDNHEFNFQRVKSTRGRFSVEVPGMPEEQVLKSGTNIFEHRFDVESADRRILFRVMYVDIPHQDGQVITNPLGAIRGFRDGVHRRDLMVSEKVVRLGNVPGIDCSYDNGQNGSVRVRFYSVGWRVYELAVATGSSNAKFIGSEDADRFFNSFVLN